MTTHAIGAQRQFVIGMARRLGGGQLDAEDLAHDVLERWLRAAPQRRAIRNPEAWMTVVLRRLVIDRARRRRARPELLLGDASAVASCDEPPPWWRELDPIAVARALPDLPPTLREAFQLFTFGARSYRQIARELNIPKATVGTRINRARALLRRRLTARCA